jgi:hypothetical protein
VVLAGDSCFFFFFIFFFFLFSPASLPTSCLGWILLRQPRHVGDLLLGSLDVRAR